jgi:glycosyltransferase involved in cell wall biosynthesis
MAAPFISIITPSFNRVGFIREAVESVLSQDYPEFEHIIADGASTDGTLELLRQYPHLRLLSEPDSGMYEAINRGLGLARGDIVGLLNTDDLYAPGAFAAVAAVFAGDPGTQAVVGGAQVLAGDSAGTRIVKDVPPIRPEEFWYRLIQGHPVTNAWFLRREIFARVGLMDAGYQYAGDREFLIRAALAGVRPVALSATLYCYRQHAGSATISNEDSREAKRGSQRLAVLWEEIRLQEGFLGQTRIADEPRRQLRAAHSSSCYRASMTAFYHRRFSLGLTAARQGLRYDPLWPLVFLRHLSHRILQEFGLREPV